MAGRFDGGCLNTMAVPIPASAECITPAWLSQVLPFCQGAGAATVTACTATPIGQDLGFTGGRLYRITLTYADGPATGPLTIVAKLSPADPDRAREFSHANQREVAFYAQQGKAGFAGPQGHYSACETDHGTSIILMQDLGHLRAVPFVQGMGPRDAGAVIDTLAALHCAWWNSPDLGGFGGAALADEFDLAGCWARFPAAAVSVVGQTEIRDSFWVLGHSIVAHRAAIFGDLGDANPLTCVHRDLQADNVMFDDDGRAVLFDWQMVGRGRGVSDVAYLLISSLLPEVRRTHERALVARYHQALLVAGITGYSAIDCWRDYLRGCAGKFLLTVVASVLFDNASAHKRAWRRADLTRLMAFCHDHKISVRTFMD